MLAAVAKRPTLRTFCEIAAEPDEAKRREACMAYLEQVWEEARIGRTYTNAQGVPSNVPDFGVMRDIALALPELMGVSAPTSAKKLPSLAVFSGKKTG
jgi:hypothetical protein